MADQYSHGLEALPCKVKLWCGARSAGSRGWLLGYPAAALALAGWDGGDAARLCTVMCGGRARGMAQAETQES